MDANLKSVVLLLIVTFSVLSFKCEFFHNEIALPTREMSNTYQKGDWFSLNANTQIKRNDLVAFKRKGMLYDYAVVNDTDYLRVVGMPGDSIRISNGIVWINNQPWKAPSSARLPYIINIKELNELANVGNYTAGADFADQFDGTCLPMDYALVNLDSAELVKMNETHKTVSFEDFNYSLCQDTVLPMVMKKLKWNHDVCPSLYIPRKRDSINIPNNLFKYYSNGDNQFQLTKDNRYIIKNDMYFLLGDNWEIAFDSRQFGLVKKEDILGVVDFKRVKGPNDKRVKEVLNYFSFR